MANAYPDIGIQSRMNRIINPKDDRVVMLAIDHPYFQGPTTGLRNMSKTIKTLLPYCDCLMTTRGAVRCNMALEDVGSKPIMLRVSGGNSVLNEELSDEKLTVTIKESIRMDAAGVAVSVYIGSANQQQTILNLTDMINQAEEYGIPVLAVTAVGKNMARDLRYLALASRICQDAGARIIKTYYCDEFSRLVDAVAPTAVVVAGGKYSSPPDALQMAYNSVQAGAVGVDFGRNIFQDDNPVGMITAISAIVHGNHTVKEAMNMYTACLPNASKLD
ncbi:MAG: 3-hydroxy-5-phosphonooxypentane-2,4-dione thiolase [Methanoregulaceae archaeon]|nr:3-hydroxy-5-phosphonooxypentane-2,4-dione thiolase [Methanoregulaceae archaeon]